LIQTLPETSQKPPSANRFFNLLALLGMALALWAAFWRGTAFHFFSYDDTFIGLRYVANFLTTGHFEWNVGEAVEGYTDPLRLWMIAGLGALGMNLLDAARSINAVAHIAFALMLFQLMRKRLGWVVALLPAGLALSYTPLIAWIWGGLDPPLTVLLIGCAQAVMFAAFTDPERRNPRMAALSAVIFALAFLVRMDSALYAVPAGLAWWFLDGKGKRNFLLFCAIFGGVAALQVLARYGVYGELLPNTFYNKVMGTPAVTFAAGFKYIFDGLKEYPFYYVAGIFALVALAIFRPAYRGFMVYALAGLLLTSVYIASVGGDFMPGFRFMMPWVPACLMGIALMMEVPLKPVKGAEVMRYAGLVICLLLLKANFVLPPDMKAIDGTVLAGIESGGYIAKNWPKGSVVALNSAGIIPYMNLDKTFIDMLGLNDKHIARRAVPDYGLEWQKKPGHGKGDGAYVLSRKPDYIILSSVVGDNGRGGPVFVSDYELKTLPEFKRCYKQERVQLAWPQVVRDQGVVPKAEVDAGLPFAYYKRTCKKNYQRTTARQGTRQAST
jgi:arabinofuranosyltransferase